MDRRNVLAKSYGCYRFLKCSSNELELLSREGGTGWLAWLMGRRDRIGACTTQLSDLWLKLL